VEELKNLLKQRHEERVNHRQELREAYGKLEAQASAQNQEDQRASHQEQKESDEEARHFLPEAALEIQPVCLPEFPMNFRTALEELPRHMAWNAMAMIGRLSSGEAAAPSKASFG